MIRILSLICLMAPSAFAQRTTVPNITPKGVAGSVGGGYSNFRIKAPDQSFLLDRGVFAAVSGERGFGFHLYLTLSLNYLNGSGQANYDYSTLSGVRYKATDVAFQAQMFQVGLGLKLKLIDHFWFRPYIEGGGLGGYYQLRYTNKADVLKTTGTDYKTADAIMDSGYYGEAGLEVAFSDAFGVRLAGRLAMNTTAEVETLGRQEIRYESQIYYLALLSQF